MSSIPTPLSGITYGSRFTTNIDLIQLENEYNYVNMVFHGFYGGTSLQAAELNELQENIQNQLSQSNNILKTWFEFYNGVNVRGTSGGLVSFTDTIIPVDVNGIERDEIDMLWHIKKGWYAYTDTSGYKFFITLPDMNPVNIFDNPETRIFNRIRYRIANSRIPVSAGGDDYYVWDELEDSTSNALDEAGAQRVQYTVRLDEGGAAGGDAGEDTSNTSLNYVVWGAHWSGAFWDPAPTTTTMFDHLPGTSGYGHPNYLLNAIVPIMRHPPTLNNFNNLFRLPGNEETHIRYDPNYPNSMWDLFLHRMRFIPLARRCLWISHTAGDLASDSRRNYAANVLTSDGIVYNDRSVLSPWMDQNQIGGIAATNSLLDVFKTEDISFAWNIDDKEAETIFQLDGNHSYAPRGLNVNGFPIEYTEDWQPITPNAEAFAAIIKDPRFTEQVNPYTGLTFAKEFENNFYKLAIAHSQHYTGMNRIIGWTYGALLQPWINEGLTNYPNLDELWNPGYSNTTAGITGIDNPFNPYGVNSGYELYHYVIPAWKATLDNLYYNNYIRKMNQVSFFARPEYNGTRPGIPKMKHSQYFVYPISAEESVFTQDSNNKPIYSPIQASKYATEHYAFNNNIVFASWAPPWHENLNTPGVFLSSEADTLNFNQEFILRSGYIGGSDVDVFTDLENYTWVGYHQSQYNGQAGHDRFVRYPTVYPINNPHTGVDYTRIHRGKFSQFRTEIVFKQLVNIIKILRSSFRTLPSMWKNYVPWVMPPTHPESAFRIGRIPVIADSDVVYETPVLYDDATTLPYWFELIYHSLLHGPEMINVFDYTYTPHTTYYIQRALEEWKHYSGNNRVIPVGTGKDPKNLSAAGELSGSQISPNTPNEFHKLDRIVMHDVFDNGMISGGRISAGKYLWRITVPPKYIKYNYYQYSDVTLGNTFEEYIADHFNIIVNETNYTIGCTGSTWASEPSTSDKFKNIWRAPDEPYNVLIRSQHNRGIWVETNTNTPPTFSPQPVIESMEKVECPAYICSPGIRDNWPPPPCHIHPLYPTLFNGVTIIPANILLYDEFIIILRPTTCSISATSDVLWLNDIVVDQDTDTVTFNVEANNTEFPSRLGNINISNTDGTNTETTTVQYKQFYSPYCAIYILEPNIPGSGIVQLPVDGGSYQIILWENSCNLTATATNNNWINNINVDQDTDTVVFVVEANTTGVERFVSIVLETNNGTNTETKTINYRQGP